MSFLNRLFDVSNSVNDLTVFIQNNSIEIYDFFISQKNSSIVSHRADIEKYILPKYGIYHQLNFADSKNKTFLFCLLDVSQRFGLALEFQQLYNLAYQNNVSINSRLNATAKFLVDINFIDDYENRINEILSDLSVSFLKEEDNEQKTIATLIHFYTEVFYNFGWTNKKRVIGFKNRLLKELQKEQYKFLHTQSIDEVLSSSLDNIDKLYQTVQSKLDEILERASQYLDFNIEPHLIEADSHYAELLAGISANFGEIRNLCAKLYSEVASDEIFWSLQRGVKVLTDPNQLLAYINSYGPMHHKKLITSIEYLPKNIFNENPHCIDWGCGQGMASMILLEYLNDNDISQSISQITLIEPSLVAIKRASLHVSKFTNNTTIINTINKDLDSLAAIDFLKENKTRIHLFSNVLDMDVFSLSKLIDLIKANFPGENYFLCVSPYITDLKTARIDSFVNAFSSNDGFEELFKINSKSDDWINGWTRVVRVFKCII